MLADLLTALAKPGAKELEALGTQVGKLYTDQGFPVDMALTELGKKGYSKEVQLLILHGACQWFMEHKRSSGASEKSLDRQRKANRSYLESFMSKGEVGVY